MTTHDSTSWNVHRETLRHHSHVVDGVQFIGGKGQHLDSLIERTYMEEAHQLGNDLAECLSHLPPQQALETLDAMKGVLGDAARRHDLHSHVTLSDVLLDGLADVEPAVLPDPGPAEAHGPGRGRRRPDAAAALADARAQRDTGEVAAVNGDG